MATSRPLVTGVVALLCCCFNSLSSAQDQELALQSVESFFRSPDVDAVLLSPSGEWLGLTVGRGTSRTALAVVGVDNKTEPVVIASFADADIGSFRWVGNDRLVFTILDSQRGGGDQNFGPGLWSVHRDGTGLRQLIDANPRMVREMRSTGRELLDRNHHFLAVPKDDSNDVVVGQYLGDLRGEFRGMAPLRLNVDTSRTRSLAVGSPPNANRWLFDPKGEPHVVVVTRKGITEIYWKSSSADDWKMLTSGPSLRQAWEPSFVDGRGNLYVRVASGRDGVAALSRFDFATGHPEKDPLVSTPGFDVAPIPIFDSAGVTLLGLRVLTDASTTVWFDAGMKKVQAAVDAKLPGHTNLIGCTQCPNPAVVLVAYTVRSGPRKLLDISPAQ